METDALINPKSNRKYTADRDPVPDDGKYTADRYPVPGRGARVIEQFVVSSTISPQQDIGFQFGRIISTTYTRYDDGRVFEEVISSESGNDKYVLRGYKEITTEWARNRIDWKNRKIKPESKQLREAIKATVPPSSET